MALRRVRKVVCPECSGRGYRTQWAGGKPVDTRCPTCQGKKKIADPTVRPQPTDPRRPGQLEQ